MRRPWKFLIPYSCSSVCRCTDSLLLPCRTNAWLLSRQVDTMIVQAIGLLDDLDKELNTYAMRVREWYGWHFPEMTKVWTATYCTPKACLRL